MNYAIKLKEKIKMKHFSINISKHQASKKNFKHQINPSAKPEKVSGTNNQRVVENRANKSA